MYVLHGTLRSIWLQADNGKKYDLIRVLILLCIIYWAFRREWSYGYTLGLLRQHKPLEIIVKGFKRIDPK